MRNLIKSFFIGLTPILFAANAHANGTIAFHVKANDRSCQKVLFEYEDTKKPDAKRMKEEIANPNGKKGVFSPLITVEVEAGHHHIAQITCQGKTASKDYALIHAFDKMLLSDPLREYKSDEHHYDITDGETVYLGAFERINMGEYRARKTGAKLDLDAPIVSDQSALAVSKGALTDGAFRSSLIGVTFSVDKHLSASKDIKAFDEIIRGAIGAPELGLDTIGENSIPPSGGKGELALHYFTSGSCPKPKLTLKEVSEDPSQKSKSHKFKFKKVKMKEQSPLTFKSLPSGRYTLTYLDCGNDRYAKTGKYAEFDVFDGETTYGGEVFMDIKYSMAGTTFKLGTRERFADAQVEGGAKYNMAHRNGNTASVESAKLDAAMNRVANKLDENRPGFQAYKDAQTAYGNLLVLPKRKTK